MQLLKSGTARSAVASLVWCDSQLFVFSETLQSYRETMDQLEDEKALKMQRLCMFVSLYRGMSHGCVCIVTCFRFHALDLFTHVLPFTFSPSNAPSGMS